MGFRVRVLRLGVVCLSAAGCAAARPRRASRECVRPRLPGTERKRVRARCVPARRPAASPCGRAPSQSGRSPGAKTSNENAVCSGNQCAVCSLAGTHSRGRTHSLVPRCGHAVCVNI
ncbi:hypothetical protein T492DRAFT_939845 [Pavlovales sp. CCMP2436]|nr:hypothetical protein T492DRAFT_939845 [Pavlovales sp. CCMP2436]